MWLPRLTLVALLSLGSIACSHKRSNPPKGQPENSPESIWSFENITVQPRKGLPPPDPEIQKLLKSVFSLTFVQSNDTNSANTPERLYCAFGKLAQSKVDGKKSSAEWLQQIVLLNAQLMGQRDSMGEGLYYILRMYAYTSEHVLQINGETSVEVLAPLLDNKDENVVLTAKELLKGTEVLNPYAGFGSGQPYQFYDCAKYLRKRGADDPPWKLIALMYEADAEHAFETLAEIYLKDGDDRFAIDKQFTELKILELSQIFAIGNAEQVRQGQKKIAAKCQEIAQSRNWCVRMYVLEWIRSSFEFDDTPALLERLSNDPNLMVAARAREVRQHIRDYYRK